jgi:hypothetical protein
MLLLGHEGTLLLLLLLLLWVRVRTRLDGEVLHVRSHLMEVGGVWKGVAV